MRAYNLIFVSLLSIISPHSGAAQAGDGIRCDVQIWMKFGFGETQDISRSSRVQNLGECLEFTAKILDERTRDYLRNGMSNKLEAEYKLFTSSNSSAINSGRLTK